MAPNMPIPVMSTREMMMRNVRLRNMNGGRMGVSAFLSMNANSTNSAADDANSAAAVGVRSVSCEPLSSANIRMTMAEISVAEPL